MTSCDVIVLGLGAAGGAVAYQLARRGHDVIGIDRFGVPHDKGSSHGHTRVVRSAYFEHPDYVPLLRRSERLFEELEGEWGRTLVHKVGVLLSGPPDGAVIQGVLSSGVAVETVIEPPAALSPDPGATHLLEPAAGYAFVEETVRAHATLAQRHRARLVQEHVHGWQASSQDVSVTTQYDTYRAQALVLCLGPWAPSFLADLALRFEVRRKVLLWLAAEPGAYRDTPVFGFHSGSDFFYGFPEIERGLVKVALHSRGSSTDPDAVDRSLQPSDLDEVLPFVRRYLPKLRSEVVRHAVCLYTMTPDEHFVIDRHPMHANVAFVAGLSGHGFKFAPVLGELLADLILDQPLQYPIDFLRLRSAVRSNVNA